jgi:hypothetical protein
LDRLSYDGALQFLGGSDYVVRETNLVDDFDKSHLGATVDIPMSAEDLEMLRCRQQFVRGREGAVVVAACAPAGRFTSHNALFNSALASFQWFAP